MGLRGDQKKTAPVQGEYVVRLRTIGATFSSDEKTAVKIEEFVNEVAGENVEIVSVSVSQDEWGSCLVTITGRRLGDVEI